MEEAVELRAAAMAELRAAVAGTAEGMEEAVELQAAVAAELQAAAGRRQERGWGCREQWSCGRL